MYTYENNKASKEKTQSDNKTHKKLHTQPTVIQKYSDILSLHKSIGNKGVMQLMGENPTNTKIDTDTIIQGIIQRVKATPKPKKKPTSTTKKAKKTTIPIGKAITKPTKPTVTFGKLTKWDTATEMKATGLNLSNMETGSSPKVYPKDWEGDNGFAVGIGKTSHDFIRGHLLNEKIGGKGVHKNLAPLTRSANKKHESDVESEVKDEILNNKHTVDYHVKAVYSNNTSLTNDINTEVNKIPMNDYYKNTNGQRDTYISQAIPEKFKCSWSVKDNKGKKVKSKQTEDIDNKL